MICIRRFPGFLYLHRFIILSFIFLLFTITYLLIKWNFICTNAQIWVHVDKMCTLYNQNKATGSLCEPLCVTNAIHTLTCHSFKSSKEAVFSGDFHQTRIVFKSAMTKIQDIHWYDNGELKYPSEKELLGLIRLIVKNKLNMSLSQETLERLTRLNPLVVETDVQKRHREMENLWLLLHDNEYLLSIIYSERDIFPQLIGTCGAYYAVEYMDRIEGISIINSYNDNKEEWAFRLRIAIQIIELIDELETGFQEPFHLCDIKLDHFGIVKGANRMKFIDLYGVYPKTAVNNIIQSSPHCEKHDDCEFLDCRSRCDTKSAKCLPNVTNSNLQIVCEKIFLGWRMSNRILVPGILITPFTPSELASILRQCANPHGETGKSHAAPNEELKKRLYNTLIEIEQTITNDLY